MAFDIRRRDSDTVLANSLGSDLVDHIASAQANLRAVAQAARDAIDPVNHFRATAQALGAIPYPLIGLGILGQIVMIPWNAAAEVADVPLAPARIAINGAQAIYHGIAAGIEKIRG